MTALWLNLQCRQKKQIWGNYTRMEERSIKKGSFHAGLHSKEIAKFCCHIRSRIMRVSGLSLPGWYVMLVIGVRPRISINGWVQLSISLQLLCLPVAGLSGQSNSPVTAKHLVSKHARCLSRQALVDTRATLSHTNHAPNVGKPSGILLFLQPFSTCKCFSQSYIVTLRQHTGATWTHKWLHRDVQIESITWPKRRKMGKLVNSTLMGNWLVGWLCEGW